MKKKPGDNKPADADQQHFKAVSCESFTLTDGQGRTRARMAVNEVGQLVFDCLNNQGQTRLQIRVSGEDRGGEICLDFCAPMTPDAMDDVRLRLGYSAPGELIDGSAQLVFQDKDGKERMGFYLDESGAPRQHIEPIAQRAAR
jgi:hypothetical protein